MPLFNIVQERVFLFNLLTKKSNTEIGKIIDEAISSIIKHHTGTDRKTKKGNLYIHFVIKQKNI